MRTFIYIATDSSPLRGYNRSIRVYELINNKPEYLGCDEKIRTASYRGDKAVACQIVADAYGVIMAPGGYDFEAPGIDMIDV